MKFGHLDSIEEVDFTLPEDAIATADTLNRSPSGKQPMVYLACPGWAEKGFVGKIVPPKTPAGKFLYHYSRSFNAIELNTTFYRIDKNMVQRWEGETPTEFRFCPKITRQISHYRQLQNVNFLMDEFVDAVTPFGEKLGPTFLLLPPNFTSNRLHVLQHFLEALPKGFSFAVELRHESWYTDPVLSSELFAMFRGTNTIAILTDVSGRRDVLHMEVTSPTTIIRFVGNELHDTDFIRLESWIDRLKAWHAQGLEEVYFFLHQPDEALNVPLATYLSAEFKRRNGWDVQAPRMIEEQASLF